jgi:phosphoribosylamine--glycine ligase
MFHQKGEINASNTSDRNYRMVNILLIGSGGREHALAWKMAQSSMLRKLYISPGNPGTAEFGTNVTLGDFPKIKKFILENAISMVVVGPEDPLVKGIHDYLKSDKKLKHVAVIGPNQAGARLEGSKKFSKEFLKRHSIPTAKYVAVTAKTLEKGYAFLDKLKPPYVLKADGLAAGKGVIILNELEEARKELKSMILDKKFGDASKQVVIEEFMKGIELSVFAVVDGEHFKLLPEAKDYKRIGEGDTGLNTGGMGAVSPVPFANELFMEKVRDRILKPTLNGLKKEGIHYQGFLFIGLMNIKGDPYVVEFNVRLGDPETQVVLPRLKSDLIDLFDGIATGTLSEKDIEFDHRPASAVVAVSGGYPGSYAKNKKITGLESVENSLIFQAGTKQNKDLVTSGGRVLACTSFGKDVQEAARKSIKNLDKIHFDGMYFRRDIGLDV